MAVPKKRKILAKKIRLMDIWSMFNRQISIGDLARAYTRGEPVRWAGENCTIRNLKVTITLDCMVASFNIMAGDNEREFNIIETPASNRKTSPEEIPKDLIRKPNLNVGLGLEDLKKDND